jgi:hypothetical protein
VKCAARERHHKGQMYMHAFSCVFIKLQQKTRYYMHLPKLFTYITDACDIARDQLGPMPSVIWYEPGKVWTITSARGREALFQPQHGESTSDFNTIKKAGFTGTRR